jgi:hypothetical protein
MPTQQQRDRKAFSISTAAHAALEKRLVKLEHQLGRRLSWEDFMLEATKHLA